MKDRPYPSAAALVRAAEELEREYPEFRDRIHRGLETARVGNVADLSEAPSDRALVTQVAGHLLIFTPGTPYGGYVCGCCDFFFGASTRCEEPGTPFEPLARWCKHVFALRIVADARQLEPPKLRLLRPVSFIGVEPVA